MKWDLSEILVDANQKDASDIHFTVGRPPILRVRGELINFGTEHLTPGDVQEISDFMMSEAQKEIFEKVGEVDFSWSEPQLNRYRVNVYRQRGSCTIAMRRISNVIPKFEDIGLPDTFKDLSMKPRGLVLVTGPTGAGKTTTLASMIGHINENKRCHVLTIEEPIEYLHSHNLSIVNQREVGSDTSSFAAALRSALREDPDVILVGEMRDFETISTAITAAETGHFVMSTLHTTTAAQTVDRIIDTYPPYQQDQIRNQLSSVLEGIICQQLIRTADKSKLVPAFEILLMNDAVRNLIRENKVAQIETVLQTNINFGMAPMDYSLARLVKRRIITLEDGLRRCVDPEVFNRYMGH